MKVKYESVDGNLVITIPKEEIKKEIEREEGYKLLDGESFNNEVVAKLNDGCGTVKESLIEIIVTASMDHDSVEGPEPTFTQD